MQTGQRVGDRHLDGILHVVAQMVGVAPLANLGAGASQQFVLVDRAQQIIIDADFETAEQPRVVFGIGDGEDRHVPVRSSDRAWLHSRKPSKLYRPSETISRS